MLGGLFWLIATSRNALIVLITSLGAYHAHKQGDSLFVLTGTVRSGLPDFGLPPFKTTVDGPNGTLVEMNFMGMVSILKT